MTNLNNIIFYNNFIFYYQLKLLNHKQKWPFFQKHNLKPKTQFKKFNLLNNFTSFTQIIFYNFNKK